MEIKGGSAVKIVFSRIGGLRFLDQLKPFKVIFKEAMNKWYRGAGTDLRFSFFENFSLLELV